VISLTGVTLPGSWGVEPDSHPAHGLERNDVPAVLPVKLVDLGPEPLHLCFELEHALDPRQAQALIRELPDSLEQIDVGLAVATASALGPAFRS